MRIKKC